MISARWLEKRRPYWSRLDEFVGPKRHRISKLNSSELQELALLYRQTASDLATVREDATSAQLTIYLNQLLGRAHNLIYMGRRAKPAGIWKFYRDTYPAIFRETFSDTFAAFIIFFATAVVSFLAAMADPTFARFLLGGDMITTIENHQMWTQSIVTVKPLASSAILTNNLSVAFATFALGITAGIGTVWMMVLNGLLIGVVAEACWREGMSLQLWSFVAGHGVLELPAIFIAGGAGLGIARGLLFPGQLPRRASLAIAGARSVKLMLGTIPMLLIAGLVEGFISPSNLPVPLKFLLSAALGTLLVLYLLKRPSTVRDAAASALEAG